MSPVHCQASFSQVSCPNSPGPGSTSNFHLNAPVRASNARISPGTISCRDWLYPCSAEFPTTITPFTTIAGEELVM